MFFYYFMRCMIVQFNNFNKRHKYIYLYFFYFSSYQEYKIKYNSDSLFCYSFILSKVIEMLNNIQPLNAKDY